MSVEVQELAVRYGAAWAEHDLDAVIAMHTNNTVFHLHGGGEPASGRDATREAFAAVLAQGRETVKGGRTSFRAHGHSVSIPPKGRLSVRLGRTPSFGSRRVRADFGKTSAKEMWAGSA